LKKSLSAQNANILYKIRIKEIFQETLNSRYNMTLLQQQPSRNPEFFSQNKKYEFGARKAQIEN